MLFKFLSICLSLNVLAGPKVKDKAGFILFFQPLYEMPEETSQAYLKNIRETLKKFPSKNIDFILSRNYQNDICAKKKLKTCVHGLYRINSCVKARSQTSQLCANNSFKANTSNYFQESVFNRLNWNHFALQLSRVCQQTQSNACKNLAKVHSKYFKIYRKFIKEKRKKKKSKKAWDL